MHSRPRHPALDTLVRAILEIPAPFACGGTLLPPSPLRLRLASGPELPIARGAGLDDQAELIAPLLAQARPAPFGKGQRTLRDRSVRDAFQLQAAGGAVELVGFDPATNGVVESIRAKLAPLDPSPLTAELYDINVYGPNGHFVGHKDTPRGSDMLGTLVVCLPVRFTGGTLIVEHRGAKDAFDWGTAIDAQAEAHRVHWAAFFGDVDHRVEEVRRGHRITASYVLRRGAGAQRSTMTESRAEALVTALREALADRWFMVEGGVLALPCMHLYSHDLREAPSSTPLDRATAARLKSADADMAAAALDAGLTVRLTPFLAETCANDTWRLKRFPTPKEIRSLSGRVVEDELERNLPVESRQQEDAWADEPGPVTEWVLPAPSGPERRDDADPEKDPATRHLGYAEYSATGYFGNEGSDTEFYLYAALEALVPPAAQRKLDRSEGPARERADRAAIDAIVAAGPEVALKVLVRLTAEKTRGAAEDARALARALVDGWPQTGARYRARGERPPRALMLELLAEIDDAPLLAQFIDRVIVPSYDGKENAELAAALVQLDPKYATSLCPSLFAAKGLTHPTACAALLERIAEGLGSTGRKDKAVSLEAAAGLLLALSADRGGRESPLAATDGEEGVRAPTFLVALFSGLEAIGDRTLWQRAVAQVAERPERYPGDMIALALAELAPRHPAAGWLPDLWRIGVERLLARSEDPIPPPPDWVEERALRCECRDCARASELLRSPVERTGRFPMAEARRHHVDYELRKSGCEVETATERRGNPYALVVTKTRKRHQQRLDLQALDLAALGWLGALEIPLAPAELRERARRAGQRPEVAGTSWPPESTGRNRSPTTTASYRRAGLRELTRLTEELGGYEAERASVTKK